MQTHSIDNCVRPKFGEGPHINVLDGPYYVCLSDIDSSHEPISVNLSYDVDEVCDFFFCTSCKYKERFYQCSTEKEKHTMYILTKIQKKSIFTIELI